MDLGLMISYGLIAVSGAVLLFFVIRNMIRGVKRVISEEGNRIAYIKENLADKDIDVVEVSKKSAQDCYFSQELPRDQGQVYVFYQVTYMCEEVEGTGWAVLGIRPSTRPTADVSKEWLWRLSE